MLFATGMFSIGDDGIITAQRFHDETSWDGDPASDEHDSTELNDTSWNWHGYVSNVGDVATIHILSDYNNKKNISEVKRVFFLTPENGVNEVCIEEWNR